MPVARLFVVVVTTCTSIQGLGAKYSLINNLTSVLGECDGRTCGTIEYDIQYICSLMVLEMANSPSIN